MKVAVSDSGGSLEAPVDQRFRLFPYFVIVETETMAFESVQNSNKSSLRGAGIGGAQVFSNKGLEAVLTEAVRPNAMEVLSQAGIKISTGTVGSVRQSIEAFNRGELKEAPRAWYRVFYGRCDDGGVGRGRGVYQNPYQTQIGVEPSTSATKGEEKEALSIELDGLKRRPSEVNKRLEELKR